MAWDLAATASYNVGMVDPNPYEPPRDVDPPAEAKRKPASRREIVMLSAMLLFAALNSGVAGMVQASRGEVWPATFAFTFAFGMLAALVVYQRRRRLPNQEKN